MDLNLAIKSAFSLDGRQSASLADWNAPHEGFSIRHDWWYKAGAAVVSMVRSAVATIANQPTTASQLAHA